jgi:DNA-binding NarL/FixJ family response regulator
VEPIRVYLGPMPEMLRAIIFDLLSSEADLTIVGNSAAPDECLRAAREERAAVIIVQDTANKRSTCLDLVLADPPVGVLAVSTDGQSAAEVSLVRRPITLDSGSPSILADAIRRMAAELSAAIFEHTAGETSRISPAKAHDRGV